MKKIKITKKLGVNKTTIATLNDEAQANVVGGAGDKSLHYGCLTSRHTATCGIACVPSVMIMCKPTYGPECEA